MFALIDTNRRDLVISRHRSERAAALGAKKYVRALRKQSKQALDGTALRLIRRDLQGYGLDYPTDDQQRMFALCLAD